MTWTIRYPEPKEADGILLRLSEDYSQREAFEAQIQFDTAAKVEATFPMRGEAIAFLKRFA